MASTTETNPHQWLLWGQRALAIAQSGLTYTTNEYEIDRYKELQKLANEIQQVRAKGEPLTTLELNDYYQPAKGRPICSSSSRRLGTATIARR